MYYQNDQSNVVIILVCNFGAQFQLRFFYFTESLIMFFTKKYKS